MSADETRQSDEQGTLMRLAVAYYTPLGWALADGDDVDPDDLAECLREMEPVAAEVERIVAERIAEALRDAADAALTMYDPPVEECITWSEWLRARADYRRIRPGGGSDD